MAYELEERLTLDRVVGRLEAYRDIVEVLRSGADVGQALDDRIIALEARRQRMTEDG